MDRTNWAACLHTFRASLQQVKNSLKDLSILGVNAAKTFEHTSAETVRLEVENKER